eukprot:m.42554 g.42554  ORF g.42554 m.42554 type:complete len:413 (+) comp11555_c0_seq3:227-1465(+)
MTAPSAWNARDKSPLLEVHQNVILKYLGTGETDKDAAAVRANHPLSASSGLGYFEIKIISKGRDGYIGIGLCGPQTQTNRLPGWEKNSYGYHGDDGHSFCCSGTGTPYGPKFTTGDVIGCCVNFLDFTCFYTKNGQKLDVAFRNLGGKDSPALYPCVGLRTPGEEVQANFGQQPFEFNIDAYREELQARARKMVEETPLGDLGWQSTLNQLVTSYLVHHGYSDTAAILAKSSRQELSESIGSITNRKRIRDFVTEGKLAEAIAAVQQHYPTLLEKQPDLLFRLECQRFVELVSTQTASGQQSDEGLEQLMSFGRQLQAMCPADMDDGKQLLQEIFSLLAYPDPRVGPMAFVLDPARREPLAVALNSAILGSLGLPSEPPLENIVRQSATCLEHMRRKDMGAAAFLSVDQFLA